MPEFNRLDNPCKFSEKTYSKKAFEKTFKNKKKIKKLPLNRIGYRCTVVHFNDQQSTHIKLLDNRTP